jgi:hypothetical protein
VRNRKQGVRIFEHTLWGISGPLLFRFLSFRLAGVARHPKRVSQNRLSSKISPKNTGFG